jgi:hypothetical protein
MFSMNILICGKQGTTIPRPARPHIFQNSSSTRHIYPVQSNETYRQFSFLNRKSERIIREETGCSKELLLSLIMARSLLNTYRVKNPDARFTPIIWVDRKSAALVLRIRF